jgi:cob(I)alamin adenosyltransferase
MGLSLFLRIKTDLMKIYTKTGDQGDTSLFSGKRVRKNNIRIDSYGTIDELNSYLGLIRDHTENRAVHEDLIRIQSKLFTIGAMLATPTEKGSREEKKSKLHIELIGDEDILHLENEMDKMNETLPEMTHFILPGGHPAVSFCHVARCVCRRAERKTVELHDLEGVDTQILIYLNRLSDYLFVMARKLTRDMGVEEVPWKG